MIQNLAFHILASLCEFTARIHICIVAFFKFTSKEAHHTYDMNKQNRTEFQLCMCMCERLRVYVS